jgi:hypothetical protein
LTLEPPAAWPLDAGEVGRLLRELGLSAVGHTSPHLPSPRPSTGSVSACTSFCDSASPPSRRWG